jgi:hypothetical protein
MRHTRSHATKILTARAAPVTASKTGSVSPAKSTSSFSPAAWLCRMVAVTPRRHSS